MADAMLRSEEGKNSAMLATKETLKDTNVSKGKGKKVSPPPAVPSTSKDDPAMIAHARVASQKSANPAPSAPTPPAPAVVNFNQEAIAILRQMNAKQSAANDKVEQLSQRVDELYSLNLQSEETENLSANDCVDFLDYQQYDYDNDCQYEEEENVVPLSGHSQQASPKRPVEDDTDSVFDSYLKKYRKSADAVDTEVNPKLADIVNNAFREGMPDDIYNELIKGINRPSNCESLKETRVNQGVWTILKSSTQTEDSKLRGVQNAVVKAAVNITKMMNAGASKFDQKMLDWGTDVIGILGQANKWLNVRRKELHKRDMDPKLHYLCSSSLQSTDQLYGDSIIKDIKDAQEFNKISRQVGMRGRGRGKGRAGYPYRGRFRGTFSRKRGSYASSTMPKPSLPMAPKNSKPEHKK